MRAGHAPAGSLWSPFPQIGATILMTIRFTCPGCKTRHELADDMAGKTIVCPCGAKLKLPAVTSSKGKAGSAPPAANPAHPAYDPAAGYGSSQGGYGGGAGYSDPPGYSPAPGYGPAPSYGPGPAQPGTYNAPGANSQPGYGPPVMGGYPGGPSPPMGYPPAAAPYGAAPYRAAPQRRFRLRLSLELVAVVLVVVIGLGVWLVIRTAASNRPDEADPREVAERIRTAQEEMDRQRRELQRRSNLSRPSTPRDTGRISPAPSTSNSNNSGSSSRSTGPVTYSDSTAAAATDNADFPTPAIAHITRDNEAEAQLNHRVWIGNLSLCPPRALQQVRDEMSEVDGVVYGQCVYASGPGITTTADTPPSSLEITIGRALTQDGRQALESVMNNLRSTRGLRQFQWRGKSGIGSTNLNGISWLFSPFTARNAQGNLVTGATYFNVANRPNAALLVMCTIMSEADADSLHFRTLKAAVRSVEYGRWLGDQELTWVDIDGGTTPISQGSIWSDLTSNRLDLGAIPRHASKLAPEQRFGHFVLRRPQGLTADRDVVSAPWFGWKLTNQTGSASSGAYRFYVCVRTVNPSDKPETLLWESLYGRGRLSVLRNSRDIHWSRPASGIDQQNGLTYYRLIGRGTSLLNRPEEVLYYAAIHDGQMIAVVGLSPDPAENNPGYELMEAAARTLRPLRSGEQIATPIALVDDPKSDRLTMSSTPTRPPVAAGLPDWSLPSTDPSASGPETRFGLFALRLPAGYEPAGNSSHTSDRLWYFTKSGPGNSQCVLEIETRGALTSSLSPPRGTRSLRYTKGHRIKWDDERTEDCKLGGLPAQRVSGEVIESYNGPMVGTARAVVAWYGGQDITITAYTVDGLNSHTTLDAMVNAMRTLRPLSPGDKVPTVPTAHELYLRQQAGID